MISRTCALMMIVGTLVQWVTPALSAQERRRGPVVGGLCARQIWQPEAATSCRGGLTIGVYAIGPTPAAWVSIHAEGAYTQRGSEVVDENGLGAAIRSHSVTAPVLVRFAPPWSRVQPFIEGGFSLEYLIHTQADAPIRALLRDEAKIVFNGVAAAGLSFRVNDDVRLELWGRLTEGLNNAYAGDFLTIRNRSREFAIGLVRPF